MSPPRRDRLESNTPMLLTETRTESRLSKEETLEKDSEETDAEETDENPGPQGARQD